MTGTPAVGAWVAQIVFWAVILVGALGDALRPGLTVVFLVLWSIGYFVLPRVTSYGEALTTPYVALLDIGLVLVVFHGDVRLS